VLAVSNHIKILVDKLEDAALRSSRAGPALNEARKLKVRQISVDRLWKERSTLTHENIERHCGINLIADTANNLAPCTGATTDTTHEYNT
jgi:hypothetical protein